MVDRTRLSKLLAYLLRHNPRGPKMTHDGFVELKELLRAVQEQYPEVGEVEFRHTIEEDPKGRYELQGNRVRAKYGHSMDISVELPQAAVDRFYHGTTPKASRRILYEGLKPRGRRKVHLSASIRDAIEVGKRRCRDPIVLEIDVKGARKTGVRIEKASEHVYVADEVPARFIKIYKSRAPED